MPCGAVDRQACEVGTRRPIDERIVEAGEEWSKVAEALVQRLLVVLFSMYFDDGAVQDWARQAAPQGSTHIPGCDSIRTRI